MTNACAILVIVVMIFKEVKGVLRLRRMTKMAQSVTKDVYTFLRQYAEEYGYPPSQREIAKACYMSRAGVIRHLDRLEYLGCIRRQPALARGITITDVPFPELESDLKK